MKRPPRKRLRLVALVLVALAACDNRACLAQSDLFSGFREELILECCECLAFSGTRFPGASCGEAVLDEDGNIVVPEGSGPTIPADAEFDGDDLDRRVDDGEIPCLCGLNSSQCVNALSTGAPIVVTGACISQGSDLVFEAPCEAACRGVLTFDPITVEE